MKILLIGIQNSGARQGHSGIFHPFGLAYISAVLKKKGYDFDCIDLHNEEIIKGRYLDPWAAVKSYGLSQYDVVAFGGTFLKFKILKSLSEKIRDCNRDIFQIAGGNMATIIADIILKETEVDCVCLSEGEDTIIELLDGLRGDGRWRSKKGLKYVDGNGRIVQTAQREKIDDLDRIPFPDRENWLFDITRKAFPYGSPGRYCAVVFASRGCPFSCIFCNPTTGKRIRSRSPENIIEEIEYLKQNWNIGYIRFFDENFIGSKSKIMKLCELMVEEKINIFWWCQIQISLVDEELLKMMKRAGCIEISYGIESGSNVILSEMKKMVTVEFAKKTIELTYRIGIRPTLNLISGTPSETQDTLKETRDFVKSLNYIEWPQVPTIDFIIPIPNTILYDMAIDRKLIVDEKRYLTEELFKLGRYTKSINLTGMPDNVFIDTINRCNREIADDYYFKHPWKKILSFIGLDHLRLDLIFNNFNLRQITPLVESLLWASIGKRNNFLGRRISGFIYKRGTGMKRKKDTYWKTFLGIPRYKIDWYFKYYLYKIFGFTFDKLKDQKEYWNTRGRQYYDEFFDTEYHKHEEFFQDMMLDELHNLDFDSFFEAGCGFGWNVKRVKKEFPNVRVSGLDFSLPQLQNSRFFQPDITMPVVLGDACNMPLGDKSFDVGFTMGVFMNIHPHKIEKAIDEILRVSKKYIIHIEWDQSHTTSELREKRIFKTNIVSHNYRELYEKRGKKILKFATYKNFEDIFHKRFPKTKVGCWEQFEGPEKYTLTVVKV